MAVASELPIDTSATAVAMAEEMFGSGIKIVSADYTGATTASGIYTDGDATSAGFVPSDTGVILSTGNATDVTNSSGDANVSSGTTTDHFLAGDAELSEISGQTTYDAAVFEAEFVPEGSTMTMQIVFSSEEYLEFVNFGFNDAVGVWVNGEQATLTVGDGDISIDNINDTTNENLYVDNPASADTYNTEMDGFTVTLTLKADVKPGEVNTIKIGIADGGDGSYDSNLLIAGDSVQTSLVAEDDQIELDADLKVEYDVLANDTSSTGSVLTITEINGQPVSIGDTITVSTGETLTLTKNGIEVDASSADAPPNTFSYTVADELGNTDTAFVEVTDEVHCFLSGTAIATATGERSVETLRIGDMIATKDHGYQAIKWIASRSAKAGSPAEAKRLAPIMIKKDALGPGHPSRDLFVSRQHRILIRSRICHRMFGEEEVIIPAKDLLSMQGVEQVETGGRFAYFHLLLNRHEIVFANGAETESLFFGERAEAVYGQKSHKQMATAIGWARSIVGHTSVRKIVQGKPARKLVERHNKNSRPLVRL